MNIIIPRVTNRLTTGHIKLIVITCKLSNYLTSRDDPCRNEYQFPLPKIFCIRKKVILEFMLVVLQERSTYKKRLKEQHAFFFREIVE
jgi:hypothetical protein